MNHICFMIEYTIIYYILNKIEKPDTILILPLFTVGIANFEEGDYIDLIWGEIKM